MIILNRYEYNPKTDLIGTGGFSSVYIALDKKFNRRVALKIYKTTEIADRYDPIAEIQRVADLEHPNICRYLDIDEILMNNTFGEQDRIQVCIMELLDGGTIAKYFKANPDLEVLKKLILEVLHGLSYLHKKGIIHGDIKPGNILIRQTEEGPVAKITDFGVSKLSDVAKNDNSSTLIVSIPYLAPEQLNPTQYGIGENISFNLDLWTLGVAVYEIITGNTLFKTSEKGSSEEIMYNIQSLDLSDFIKILPQPFRAFVSECLIRDAKTRVKSAETMIPVLMADYPREISTEKISFFVAETATPAVDLETGKELSEDQPEIIANSVTQKLLSEQELMQEEIPDPDATRVIPKSIIENSKTEQKILSEEKTDPDATHVIPKPVQEDILLNEELKKNEPDDQTTILKNTSISKEEIKNIDETKILNKANTDTNTTGLFQRKEGPVLLFNRYEYIPSNDLIGKGGFSRVYKAYDQKLNRWVALKVYKTGEFSDRYSPISEIRRVINLDHSNICRYLDIEEIEKENHFGENEKIQVCVMELLDSGNFLEYYSSNKDPIILQKLIRDILHGLSYLHKNGIIHRDIKPANILIKNTIEGPVAKITDFGISKISDSVNNNSSSALIVSIPYMAPEQLNPKKYGINEKISYNLDLWSLGVTIYEVITGDVLFKNSEQDNSEQIMTNIMAPGLPDKINILPEPFRNIVAHCIMKDANERAKKAEELLVLLDEVPANISYHTIEKPDQVTTLISGKKFDIYHTETKTTIPDQGKTIETIKIPTNTGSVVKIRPGIRLNYLQISAGIGIIFILLIVFLFFKNSRVEHTIPNREVKKDTTQIVKVRPSIIDTSRKKEPALVPASPVNDSARQIVRNDSKIAAPHKTDHPAEKKKERVAADQNQAHQTHTSPVVNGSQKYILELTTTQNCTIKINSMDIGTLETGKTMKVYLKPGKYLLQATSVSNSSAVYTGNLQIDPEEINEVGKLKIRL